MRIPNVSGIVVFSTLSFSPAFVGVRRSFSLSPEVGFRSPDHSVECTECPVPVVPQVLKSMNPFCSVWEAVFLLIPPQTTFIPHTKLNVFASAPLPDWTRDNRSQAVQRPGFGPPVLFTAGTTSSVPHHNQKPPTFKPTPKTPPANSPSHTPKQPPHTQTPTQTGTTAAKWNELSSFSFSQRLPPLSTSARSVDPTPRIFLHPITP